MYYIQAEERMVDVPTVLQQERAVEVPVIQSTEVVTQVPRPEVQYIDKPVTMVRTEAREQLIEVPQIFYEERLVEVPQMQVAEVMKQVSAPRVQEILRQIPKYETQIIEKVVPHTMMLTQETAMEVPQVCVQEVVRQVASSTNQQRIVQTGVEWERHVGRDEVVQETQEAQYAGVYESQARMVEQEMQGPYSVQGPGFAMDPRYGAPPGGVYIGGGGAPPIATFGAPIGSYAPPGTAYAGGRGFAPARGAAPMPPGGPQFGLPPQGSYRAPGGIPGQQFFG